MCDKIDFGSYDSIIVAFSGGKDSISCVLDLIEKGVPRDKIELWHHEVDGREGSSLMDWPVTKDYCRKFAQAFSLKIYYSWKHGGFEREMLRENCKTAPISFETPDGIKTVGGTRGKNSTRRKMPQISADLSVRWCSAYLKVDVCAAAIRNQDRFLNKRTLLVTGERAEESTARAKYNTFEVDRADNRDGVRIVRHVDRYRPIHNWLKEDVWAIIERWRVNAHPAYHLGWGRLSCMKCIFGSKNQWATIRAISNKGFTTINSYENEFGVTIQRTEDIVSMANKGKCYPAAKNLKLIKLSKSTIYTDNIILDNWVLPAGAFGEDNGPT